MRLMNRAGALLSVLLAALVGTTVGNGLRLAMVNRQRLQSGLQDAGEELVITGVLTNSIVAWQIGLLARKPHWLYAFAYGALFSLLTGDRPDRALWSLLRGRSRMIVTQRASSF